jgi:hypothetical protein
VLQACRKGCRAGEGEEKDSGSDEATYAPSHLPYAEPLPVQFDSPSTQLPPSPATLRERTADPLRYITGNNLLRIAPHQVPRVRSFPLLRHGEGEPLPVQSSCTLTPCSFYSLCRRCGRRSFHKQHKTCASCGFPAAKIRSCASLRLPPPDESEQWEWCRGRELAKCRAEQKGVMRTEEWRSAVAGRPRATGRSVGAELEGERRRVSQDVARAGTER